MGVTQRLKRRETQKRNNSSRVGDAQRLKRRETQKPLTKRQQGFEVVYVDERQACKQAIARAVKSLRQS